MFTLIFLEVRRLRAAPTILSRHRSTQRIPSAKNRYADSRGRKVFNFWPEIVCRQEFIPQISRSAVVNAFKYLQKDPVTSQDVPITQ